MHFCKSAQNFQMLPETQCLRAPDGQDRLFIHRVYTMSSTTNPLLTSKGPKPNPDNQSRRVLTNQLARDERIKRRLSQQRGREAEHELPEYASGINRLVGVKRQKHLIATINALREERQKTEKNNTNNTRKAGTKRKITNTPSHTDYSTNSESEEHNPEIPAYRQILVEEQGPMTNSNIFKVTQNMLKSRSHERNLETKKRHPKREKTQSAQEPGVFKKLQNWVRKTVKSFQN